MRKFNVFRQVPTLFDPFETDDMEATEASSLTNLNRPGFAGDLQPD